MEHVNLLHAHLATTRIAPLPGWHPKIVTEREARAIGRHWDQLARLSRQLDGQRDRPSRGGRRCRRCRARYTGEYLIHIAECPRVLASIRAWAGRRLHRAVLATEQTVIEVCCAPPATTN